MEDLVIFDAVVKAEFINFGVFAPLPCTVYLVKLFNCISLFVSKSMKISSKWCFLGAKMYLKKSRASRACYFLYVKTRVGQFKYKKAVLRHKRS